jgi:hypothetical protein
MSDATDVPTFDVLRAVIASDPYHQQFQPLLDHVATLTRERDDIIAICRGTQMDDAAIHSIRGYVTEKLRIEAERDAAANLLAVIHRDGGHHTGSVGFARSCADAEAAVLQDRTERAHKAALAVQPTTEGTP